MFRGRLGMHGSNQDNEGPGSKRRRDRARRILLIVLRRMSSASNLVEARF